MWLAWVVLNREDANLPDWDRRGRKELLGFQAICTPIGAHKPSANHLILAHFLKAAKILEKLRCNFSKKTLASWRLILSSANQIHINAIAIVHCH